MSIIYVTDPNTGEEINIIDLARRHRINIHTLRKRNARGVKGKALIARADTGKYVKDPANGEMVSLSELGRRYGIHSATISRRLASGKKGEALIASTSDSAKRASAYRRTENAKAAAEAERRLQIISASRQALTRPLNHIVDANKKGMQA